MASSKTAAGADALCGADHGDFDPFQPVEEIVNPAVLNPKSLRRKVLLEPRHIGPGTEGFHPPR